MKKLLLILCLVLGVNISMLAQSVTLNPQKSLVTVNKVDTITFSGEGVTLEEIAKKVGLRHISGKTYQAAVIYDIVFSNGGVSSQGKIFNCTDKPLNVKCSFYSGSKLIVTYNKSLKPRTFSRMIPDDVSLKMFSNCNKIVCSD